jgi:hypothetical protein
MITSPPPSLHHHYLNLQLMTCQFVRRLIDIKHDFLTAIDIKLEEQLKEAVTKHQQMK